MIGKQNEDVYGICCVASRAGAKHRADHGDGELYGARWFDDNWERSSAARRASAVNDYVSLVTGLDRLTSAKRYTETLNCSERKCAIWIDATT